jgi:hypothetical protein
MIYRSKGKGKLGMYATATTLFVRRHHPDHVVHNFNNFDETNATHCDRHPCCAMPRKWLQALATPICRVRSRPARTLHDSAQTVPHGLGSRSMQRALAFTFRELKKKSTVSIIASSPGTHPKPLALASVPARITSKAQPCQYLNHNHRRRSTHPPYFVHRRH